MKFKLILLCSVMIAVGCGDSSESQEPAEETATDGELVYSQPAEDGNSFACATCHALSEPAADGIRRPGHPIGGANQRSTFKNGRVDSMLEAVNSCRDEWMGAPVWGPESEEWLVLEAWLDEQSGAEEPIGYQIAEPPQELDGGDKARGQRLFNASCSVCHGQDASGTTRGPSLAGRQLEPQLIASRVRKSGSASSDVYDGLEGGRMPFWSLERLADDELVDIIAFVADSEAVEPSNNTNNTNNGNNSNNQTNNNQPRECEATHSKVGQTMTFSNLFHDVGGTAMIVDDCTIMVEQFSFDGGGIDVRIYGGLGGDFDNGFPMTENLVGPAFEFVPLTAKVPEDKTLDDLDGLSVWCVDVSVSFGHGTFE